MVGWRCNTRGCDSLDSMWSALGGGKDADNTFGSLVWWWGCRPHAAGRETDTSPPGSGNYLLLPPTTQDLTQGQWPEGRCIVAVKGGGVRARTEARNCWSMLDIGSLSSLWSCSWTKLVMSSLSAIWAWWA